jgi:hypothetical protein
MKHVALLLSLLSLPAMALEWSNSLSAGFHLDTYQSDLPQRYRNESNFNLAATAGLKTLALWGNIGFRTGAFLEFKRARATDRQAVPEANVEATAYYLAVPLNLQFNLNESLAVFGGYAPRLLLARRCERCGDFDDSELLVNYANAGFTWRFNDRWSTDVSFHHALSDNFKNYKISSTQVLLNYQL